MLYSSTSFSAYQKITEQTQEQLYIPVVYLDPHIPAVVRYDQLLLRFLVTCTNVVRSQNY